jgi:hypothetical protein
LQIRDGTHIFHNKSMYAAPPEKSTYLLELPAGWLVKLSRSSRPMAVTWGHLGLARRADKGNDRPKAVSES